ncbi:MAG: VUT family protein [Proteobacteria bacterium]|nr:VUT family protein [Pseudomonadota bacterium]MDA1057456.1 VUT family protein [Pseudomonadota bacterium]
MLTLRILFLPVAAMVAIVVASNFLVQFPINDFLTWGAFTFPIAFLVTDLTNRRFGPGRARRVVYVGFLIGVVLSVVLAGPRIGIASGLAFLAGQLLDIAVFDRLRRMTWWRAPLASSITASAIDTGIFFSLAFAGTGVPWITLGVGDFGVKLAMAATLLIPYGALMRYVAPMPVRSSDFGAR